MSFNVASPRPAVTRQTFSNANVTINSTTTQLAQTGTLAATRTATLPLANSVAVGHRIEIVDESGSVTTTNTINVARSGTDLVNGGTTSIVALTAGYGRAFATSNGSNGWTIDAARQLPNGTTNQTLRHDGTTFVATSGFTVDASGNTIASGQVRAAQFLPSIYTVANLPVATEATIAYCSDCLTHAGTGALVYRLGSTWVTVEGLPVTTDLLTYFRSVINQGETVRANQTIGLFNEQIGGPSEFSPSTGTVGTGATVTWRSSTGTNIGLVGIETGSTATGAAFRTFASSNMPPLANCSWYAAARVSVSALSASTDEFSVQVGLTDSGFGTGIGARVCEFIYDRAGALGFGVSDNWRIRTAVASGQSTTQETSVAVAANTFYVLEVLASSSVVNFYINQTLVGTITTTIPTVATAMKQLILKSTGTNSRRLEIDWEGFYMRLNNSRQRFT